MPARVGLEARSKLTRISPDSRKVISSGGSLADNMVSLDSTRLHNGRHGIILVYNVNTVKLSQPGATVSFPCTGFIEALTQIKPPRPTSHYVLSGFPVNRLIMNNCIENMMEEHRLIVRVLGSLDLLADQVAAGVAVPRENLLKFCDFFRDFADKAHHGKEEDRLFRKMMEVGFPRQSGPLAVMFAEHDDGRSHVRALGEIAAKSGPLTPSESQHVVAAAREFVVLLRLHIHKEDNILYPMAQQYIPEAEMCQLDAACNQFDQETVGPERIQRLKGLAAELIAAYPAPADRLDEIVARMGCGGGGCGH